MPQLINIAQNHSPSIQEVGSNFTQEHSSGPY